MSLQTKWNILMRRAAALEAQAWEIREGLKSMERYSLGSPCTGCGMMLETEADFARHFIVKNPAHLNLGYCPVKGP